MSVHLQWEGRDRLVLSCSGEIGWNAQEDLVKKTAAALAEREAVQVVLDLEAVDLVTSAGIGGLLQVRKVVDEHQSWLVLACVPPLLRQLFRTVGLDRHVPLADTMDNARSMERAL